LSARLEIQGVLCHHLSTGIVMRLKEWIAGFRCVNLNAVSVAIHRPSGLRDYVSYCAQKYDELLGNGLPARSPIPPPPEDLTITLPAAHRGGGMSFSEMVILGRATKVMKPSKIFEIGTFNGLTTAVFILNCESATKIFTLDLPLDSTSGQGYLSSDARLVVARELGSVPRALRLDNYSQICCDSLLFDPSEFLGSIDLCLVDGAHDFAHVENDTVKTAGMVSDEGTVFWHDYGGKGCMRSLTEYLNSLGRRAQIFHVPGTSLAWARGHELKRAVRCTRDTNWRS
jgi:hypothetical protein